MPLNLFVDVARQSYEEGAEESVSEWVALAARGGRDRRFDVLNTLFADFEIENELYELHPTVQ